MDAATVATAVSMNPTAMAGIGTAVAVVIPPLMQLLKRIFPTWGKKAWFPLVFGSLASVATSYATGQIGDWRSGAIAFTVGLGAGGTASSVRDVVVGK